MEQTNNEFPQLRSTYNFKEGMTVSSIYEPFIHFALDGNTGWRTYLDELLKFEITKLSKAGIPAEYNVLRINVMDSIDYYCQYFSKETAKKVKEFYNLGVGFRTFNKKTDIPIDQITPEEVFKLGLEAGEELKKQKS